MTTYLVTGGAGFIGSHLCDALVARGDTVRVLDDLSTGTRANLPAGATADRGRRRRPGAMRAAMDGVDGCFHLAAIASVTRGVTDWLGTPSRQPHRHHHRVRRDPPPGHADPGGLRLLRRGVWRLPPPSRSPKTPNACARCPPTAPTNTAASCTPGSPATCTASRPPACASSTSTARARTRDRPIPA